MDPYCLVPHCSSGTSLSQKESTVDSKKLDYESGTICAGFPSCLGFELGGRSYSNFPPSAVEA